MSNYEFQILKTIRDLGQATRKDVAAVNSLSLPLVSKVVRRLMEAGLVEEADRSNGPIGRPASLLRIVPEAGYVIGFDVGGAWSRAVVVDLAGHVRVEIVRRTRVVDDRKIILDDLAHLFHEVIDQVNLPPESILGLGVGLRAIVDSQRGICLSWPNTPQWADAWSDLPIGPELSRRLGLDFVLVDDSVRAFGLAEQRYGIAQNVADFLYVFVSAGIGAAIFVNGQPYRGSTGLAGELGHITIDEEGPRCRCGNCGCLEVMASTSAVLRRVRQGILEENILSTLRPLIRDESQPFGIQHVVQAGREGDKLAFHVLNRTGEYLGIAIAMALNLLGSQLVIVGGELGRSSEILLEAAQRTVKLRALRLVSSQLRIEPTALGELAGARGAATFVLDGLFTGAAPVNLLVPLAHAVA